jgi:hypothetical protein
VWGGGAQGRGSQRKKEKKRNRGGVIVYEQRQGE